MVAGEFSVLLTRDHVLLADCAPIMIYEYRYIHIMLVEGLYTSLTYALDILPRESNLMDTHVGLQFE
jgi:hypothetical protein